MVMCLLFRRGTIRSMFPKLLGISQVRFAHYPPLVDWRGKEVLAPVSSNGTKEKCCYADAARAAIESIIAIASGQKKVLSVQELTGPTYREFERKLNPGCSENNEPGGREEECYRYASTYGLSSNLRWPVGHYVVSMNMPKVWIDGHVYLPSDDEELLLRAIAQQPVTAVLDVYKMYKIGLVSFPESIKDLHSILITGYNLTSLPRTITFQNNWGADWGSGGYATLSLDGPNDCGVRLDVSYPILETFPSALNSEMETIGRLFKRIPLGIPAILRFPFVVGGSMIGIRYNNGIIVSSGYGNERLKPIGLHFVIGVEEPIWEKIKDAGGYKNPINLLEVVVGVLSDGCHNLNPLRRPFVIIAGVQNEEKYLGMVMGTPSHHHDAAELEEQLDNMVIEDLNHDFDSCQACSILEHGWHEDLSLEDALRLVDAVVITHLCDHQCVLEIANITEKGDHQCVLEIANITEKGVQFFRRLPRSF